MSFGYRLESGLSRFESWRLHLWGCSSMAERLQHRTRTSPSASRNGDALLPDSQHSITAFGPKRAGYLWDGSGVQLARPKDFHAVGRSRMVICINHRPSPTRLRHHLACGPKQSGYLTRGFAPIQCRSEKPCAPRKRVLRYASLARRTTTSGPSGPEVIGNRSGSSTARARCGRSGDEG